MDHGAARGLTRQDIRMATAELGLKNDGTVVAWGMRQRGARTTRRPLGRGRDLGRGARMSSPLKRHLERERASLVRRQCEPRPPAASS